MFLVNSWGPVNHIKMKNGHLSCLLELCESSGSALEGLAGLKGRGCFGFGEVCYIAFHNMPQHQRKFAACVVGEQLGASKPH